MICNNLDYLFYICLVIEWPQLSKTCRLPDQMGGRIGGTGRLKRLKAGHHVKWVTCPGRHPNGPNRTLLGTDLGRPSGIALIRKHCYELL